MFADLNIKSYDSERAADFAAHVHERQRAERARHAGRQLAHDTAASARAAEKRAAKRHEIANRPRGRTEVIGQHPDGRPIYRAIPAFRARPYTPPIERKERPEPVTPTLNGARLNLHPTSERIAAALKAEAPQVRGQRQLEGVCPGEPFCSCWASAIALPRDTKRAARKVRMATKRRRGGDMPRRDDDRDPIDWPILGILLAVFVGGLWLGRVLAP